MDNNYTYAYEYTSGGHRGFCYRSGMMSFSEMLIDGQLISSGFQASGLCCDTFVKILNNQPAWFDPASYNWPHTFRLELDGEVLISSWEYAAFEQSRGDGKLIVRLCLKNTYKPVEVTICTILDGTAILSRTLVIKNISNRPVAITRLSPMSGGLEQCSAGFSEAQGAESPYEVGYMHNPQWANEGEFDWSVLPLASTRITGRYPETEHRHPMAYVRNAQTGAYFIIQVAWSGGYHITLDVSQNLRQYQDYERTKSNFLSLSYEAGLNAPSPLRMVMPGEVYESPEIHTGMVYGTMDDAVAENLMHVRKILSMNHAASKAYVENLLYPGQPMTDDYLDQELQFSKEVGVDVFFIDAGWYSTPEVGDNWGIQVGDWEFKRFKRSVHEIRDTIHAMGMKFGLWMEPERVGEQSKIYKNNPDWKTKLYGGCKRSLIQLDISRPEVARHVEESIARVIGEYELDHFRLDFNMGLLGEGAYNEISGCRENNYARYYEAFYGIMSRLRSRFPDVIFENCASGGARTDLGMVRYFDHTWVSDWMNAPRNFRILNGMTLALPPEYIDRTVFTQYGWWTGSKEYELDLMLFSRPTLGAIDSIAALPNPLLLEKLKQRITFYKEFVVPFMPGCLVYHHTPIHRGAHPQGFGILEYTASDKSRGMIGVFGLAGFKERDVLVKPRGLNPGNNYRITYLNHMDTLMRPGMEVIRDGLPVTVLGAINSCVITYETVS